MMVWNAYRLLPRRTFPWLRVLIGDRLADFAQAPECELDHTVVEQPELAGTSIGAALPAP